MATSSRTGCAAARSTTLSRSSRTTCGEGKAGAPPADLGAVRAAFQDWDPRLRALFGAAGDIHKWALLDHPVPAVWSRGRVALLGDACHAMLPYLAQGAPWRSRTRGPLVRSSPMPPIPSPRCRVIRSCGSRAPPGCTRTRRATPVLSHRSRRASRFARDAVLRALARKPERFLHRMDWLYGLDITQPRMLIGSVRHPRADHSAGQQHRHGYR